jgi:error-prone DNA polymerase
VNCSDWDCTLEPAGSGGYALRLGLRQIMGLAQAEAERLVAARGNGYGDPLQLWRRGAIGSRALEALARADAFRSMGLDRREALWAVKGLPAKPLPLFAAMGEEEQGNEPAAALPVMGIGEHVAEDYRTLHLSLKRHPLALLRARMRSQGYVQSSRLADIANDTTVKVAGLVLVRQRPGTASGVIFATLEDETGVANIIIWPRAFERFRRTVLTCSLMGVTGKLQREGIVIHVIADRIVDLTDHLQDMAMMAEEPEIDEPVMQPRGDGTRTALPRRDPSFPSRDFH